MRIAVIGSAGQLGTDMCKRLPQAIGFTRQQLDITNAGDVAAMLSKADVDVVVNTAAYNLVDRAESEPEIAFSVNAFGTRTLASWCGEHQKTLVHVSTDHVFGNTTLRKPLTEADLPVPQSCYAVSKLSGEYFVSASCSNHFVVRTCGLYGVAATRAKGNFVNTMLRLGAERDELKVVNDQFCTPTSTVDLADAIAKLIETTAYGTYHATNSGSTSWYDFAAEIFRLAKIDVSLLPISSAEFNAAAPRPAYSVLDSSKLERTLGEKMQTWQEALAAYLNEISC